jgi:antitoxin HicB
MFEMSYPAEITQHREGKDWVVKFPDLKGTNTGADTLDGAIEEAADCLGSYLAMLIADRKPIPEPSAAKGKQRLIAVPLWIAPKVALYRALQEQRISNSELARRLGVRETIVRRMLDPDHATRPSRLESALRAVGKRLLIAIDDAA